MTDFEYYNDEEQHGNYQYVSLSDIIDSILIEAMDDDSYLKNVKRYKIYHHALEAIKELNKKAANDVLAIEITVPDNLVVIVPKDYVNWVRVSVVVRDLSNGGFHLQPLAENRNINTAIGYLQDHKGEVLFDEDGGILTADSSNAYAHPFRRYKVNACSGGGGYVKTANFSKYGEFTIDERKGKFLFSSDLMDKEVVIEYISDGLQADMREEDITVHKDVVKAIGDYIYMVCIERKRTVPANEKHRAMQRYKASLHQAKMDRANFKLIEIARHL